MVLQSSRSPYRSSEGGLPRLPFFLALLLLCLAPSAWAATTVVIGTDLSETVIKGTLVTPNQVIDGELVIEGDTITCAAATCTTPDGATRITVTNAYILPGFVDASAVPRLKRPRHCGITAHRTGGAGRGCEPHVPGP